jgi:hypothetical protein
MKTIVNRNEGVVEKSKTKRLTRRGRGQPTKYTPITVQRLLDGISDGLSLKSACICAGIGETTLDHWRARYPELEERIAEAREEARQEMLKRIKRAAEDDWRAAAEWLRFSFPADYRRVASNTNVNVGVATQVVLSEEDRMKLIERLKKQRAQLLHSRKCEALPAEVITENSPRGSTDKTE